MHKLSRQNGKDFWRKNISLFRGGWNMQLVGHDPSENLAFSDRVEVRDKERKREDSEFPTLGGSAELAFFSGGRYETLSLP